MSLIVKLVNTINSAVSPVRSISLPVLIFTQNKKRKGGERGRLYEVDDRSDKVTAYALRLTNLEILEKGYRKAIEVSCKGFRKAIKRSAWRFVFSLCVSRVKFRLTII